jgi:SAM-dependent methyltransferase
MNEDYREDLAYIHDTGFSQMAEAAGLVLIDALRRCGHESGLVFDLGCGGGILSRALINAGYQVRGIDISPAMVSIARKRVPEARFEVGSILSAELTECVAVAAVGECLNYLFDPRHSMPVLDQLFRRIHKVLVPGGILLFDTAEPGRVPGGGPRRSFMEGEDWVVLVESEENADDHILTRRMTTFRQVGELFRRSRETHRQRLIPRGKVKATLRAIGFRVRTLGGYEALRFPTGRAGFLARKV